MAGGRTEVTLPKMYCLTCSQMPWRTEAAAERFRAARLSVEMFDGVHGPTVGIAPTLSHFDSPGHNIGSGKVAIILSKLLLWQTMQERSDLVALLFENDVELCANFAVEFAQSYDALPADWDVVHVGHCCSEDKPTQQVNDRVAEIRYPFCCHAVLWRKEAASFAAREVRKHSWGTPSDILLAHAVYPQLRHYSFTPSLASQGQTLSEAGTTGRWDTIQGWFDYARLYDEALDRVSGPATFVEVGCWKGRSTAYLAEEIKRRLLPVTLYAVDTWQGMAFGGLDEVVQKEYGGNLLPTFLQNISRAGVYNWVYPLQLLSVEAAKKFADDSLDFIFIDGDHTYDAVREDILAWYPKLKPNGVMAGHDYDMPEVKRAVQETLGSRYRTWERCWITI